MRGRPTCPTGQKKYSVGATAGSPLFYFYKERLGTKSPPHPTRLCRPTFPPRGRLWGWEGPFPSAKPPAPARPAGGRAVTDVGLWAAGQAKKKEDPRRVPPNQKRWVQGGRTSSSLVFFPPAFFQRKPGPRPGPGGQRGAAPRGFEKAPTTRRVRSTPPPPAGGAAPSHVSGSGSPRMVASGWKMAQKKSLSRARISRSSR